MKHTVALRHERCPLRIVARVLSAPLSTVVRVLYALVLSWLKNRQTAKPARSCQCAKPGGMVHFDAKKLARIEGIGHRFTGDQSLVTSNGAAYANIMLLTMITIALNMTRERRINVGHNRRFNNAGGGLVR